MRQRIKTIEPRKLVWRIRYHLAVLISPSVNHVTRSASADGEATVQLTGNGRPAGQHGLDLASASEARYEAGRLWAGGNREAARDHLRRALRWNPNDSLTWMSYGHRLQALAEYDLAYEAYLNAVEIDAGNFPALEQFLDMAGFRGEKKRIALVLRGLPDALRGKEHRHREALSFAIPYKLDAVISAVSESGDPVARAIVELQRTNGDTSADEIQSLSPDERNLSLAMWCLARGRKDAAIRAIRSLPENLAPTTSLRLAVRRELARGREAGAHKLLVEYCRLLPDESWGRSKLSASKVSSDHQLASLGFPFPEKGQAAYNPNRRKVSYLLHNSLPYHSAGYSTRTHGLLTALRGDGWDIEGVTRLGYPYDMPNFKDLGEISAVDVVNGVPYHRLTTSPSLEMKRPIENYVSRYSAALEARVLAERPFLLHAASNHWNGLTAVSVANKLGIESVYEVRGLWEVTRASRDPDWAASDAYRYMSRMESDAAKGASHVVAITHALKEELVRRGVESEKITVVSNGADTNRFVPKERNDRLARDLGLIGKTVIGYVGSVLDYEGLLLLVDSISEIAIRRDDFKVLIVGDGSGLEALKERVNMSNLQHLFTFTGRVPHEMVEDYYSLVDIAPFPRLPLPVCEMVSPLKPFEAMAMGKAVVAADVAALAEIVEDGVTGLLHQKGNSNSLATVLISLLDSPQLRLRLSRDARKWTVENRQWSQLGSTVGQIYESLGGIPAVRNGEEL